jgi:hypothetical protein
MIAVLEKYGPEDRAGLLASLALATSAPTVKQSTLSSEQQSLLHEISASVGVKEADKSEAGRARVDEFIHRVMSESVLANKDVKKVLADAGASGRLLPSMYSVEIPKGFLETFGQFHVREQDVRLNVSEPDDVQHLPSGENDAISFFVRFVEGKFKRDPFWAIAQFHRRGSVLHAHNFWRVYPSEIDLSRVYEPLHLLHALVNVVGTEIECDGHRAKFISDETLRDQQANEVDLKIEGGQAAETIATFSHGFDMTTGIKKIILAYGVSGKKYRDYLIRHGVQAVNRPYPGQIFSTRPATA